MTIILIEMLRNRRDKLEAQLRHRDIDNIEIKNQLIGAINEISSLIHFIQAEDIEEISEKEKQSLFLMKPSYEKSFLSSIREFMKGII